jgi:hypothetical protein
MVSCLWFLVSGSFPSPRPSPLAPRPFLKNPNTSRALKAQDRVQIFTYSHKENKCLSHWMRDLSSRPLGGREGFLFLVSAGMIPALNARFARVDIIFWFPVLPRYSLLAPRYDTSPRSPLLTKIGVIYKNPCQDKLFLA